VGYYAAQGSVFKNSLATLSFLGGVASFPWLLGGKRRFIIAAATSVAVLTLFVEWPSLPYRLWFIALAVSGLQVMAAFTVGARRLVRTGKNHGEALLMLWVPAVLLFFILVGDMINARYILLALPPLYLVMFASTGERELILTLVPTALLSAMLAYADLKFVNSYRDWVTQTIVPLQEQGYTTWSGAESGLRFYLEKTGMSSLSARDTRPGRGDLVITHELYHYESELLTTLRTFETTASFPIRTYNARAGAGFHDSNWGIVPFILSRAPFDRIDITQVSPLPGAAWSPQGPIFKQTEAEIEFPMRLPANSQIEYDLEGDGAVLVERDRIKLMKGSSPVTVWRNFRVVPRQFAVQ
jgi:hypothetical protein